MTKKSAPLRVATWNIACAAPLYHGRGLPGICRWLKDDNIDICLMQEVDRYAKTSHYIDYPDYFQKATGYHAFYAPSSIEKPHEPGKPPREYGNCIVSRWPMKEKHIVPLTAPLAPEGRAEWGWDTRIALIACLDTPRGDVWVATTHLTYIHQWQPDPIPEFQVKNLMHHINRLVPPDAPLVVGGDFNCDLDSPNMAALNSAMACLTANAPPTWPVDYNKPGAPQTVRLDHIFARAAKGRYEGTYVYEDLSDHAVVVAEIEPKRRRQTTSMRGPHVAD